MSEIKCPFCNSELVLEGSNNYWCKKCNLERYNPALYGSQKLWQELIRTRKALEIAWDGLEKIGSGNIIEHSVVGHEDDNKIFIANKALDESKTALEQKVDNNE